MKFNESRKLAEAIRQFDAIIPLMVNDMGQISLNHFTKSFRDQGFTDESVDKWEPRNSGVKGLGNAGGKLSTRYSGRRLSGGDIDGFELTRSQVKKIRQDYNRAILVKSGRLRRSLRKVKAGKYKARITSNTPYAEVHNRGLRSGRGAGFTMPKRQFVGFSRKMNRNVKDKLNKRIRSVFKK